MAELNERVKKCIEQKLESGFRRFVIFPFGGIGEQIRDGLRDEYGIEAEYILDNYLCRYDPAVKPLDFLDAIPRGEFCALLTTIGLNAYEECRKALRKYFADEAIVDINDILFHTEIGKYSYGPICKNHQLIESIGAFSSFALGTDVVANHPSEYVSTHPMFFVGAQIEGFLDYSYYSKFPWYFDGVRPRRDKIEPTKRIKIGNDVWLGRNVTITNSANIGNGVIAGAGSVITKDVPDYAVVVGAPARIIRFRYSPEEIASLNEIAWWDWTDDEIRERYDDFYLPIDEFIKKYLKRD